MVAIFFFKYSGLFLIVEKVFNEFSSTSVNQARLCKHAHLFDCKLREV